MRVVVMKGMVNIDNNDIAYANVRRMYRTGNGAGLQLSEKLEPKREEILRVMDELSEKIYELEDILAGSNQSKGTAIES